MEEKLGLLLQSTEALFNFFIQSKKKNKLCRSYTNSILTDYSSNSRLAALLELSLLL